MHWHTTDYLKDRDEHRGTLVDRGFWLSSVPRLMSLCRLAGHRSVVDGTGGGHRARWVVCARCGVRPDPQGRLDPARWNVGDRYDGPWSATGRDKTAIKLLKLGDPVPELPRFHPPGPWTHPTGAFGGQVIVGKSFGGFGFQVKVGNGGSEHTLAAHLRVHPIGAIYLNTEGFGQGLQRRFNPVGYESRVTGLAIEDGHLRWQLWAKRDSWSREDPQWQQGSVRIDPRDILLGPARYSYTDVGEPVTGMVRMPHGDDHEVTLKLQRQSHGRKHGRKRESWTVDWACQGGIATKPGDRGHVLGSAVPVSAGAVRNRTWPFAAAAGIADRMMQDRVRYGYRPTEVDDDWIEL